MTTVSSRIESLSPKKRELLLSKLKVSQKTRQSKQSITKRVDQSVLPLSFQQLQLWFLNQMQPRSSFYNMPAAVRLEGNLDLSAVEYSLNQIFKRHEVLRSYLVLQNGQPVQKVHDKSGIDIQMSDLSGTPVSEVDPRIQEFVAKEATRPFRLDQDLLIRCSIAKISDTLHIIVLNLHHIVADGWSVGILIREFIFFYQSHVRGMKDALPELPIQYADYAAWQLEWLQSGEKDKQLAYWKKQLKDSSAFLDLPYDYRRPSVQGFSGKHLTFAINPRVTAGLHAVAKSNGVTLYVVLLAALNTLLYRYTGQDDFNIGTAMANRERPEIKDLIGYFMNTLVMRADLAGNPTFSELLRRVEKVVLEGFANQDLPFEQVVEGLHPQRHTDFSPFFQVLFVLQNAPKGQLELPGVKLSLLNTQIGSVKFDLTLTFEEDAETISGLLGYNTDLFNGETVKSLINHFQQLLQAVIRNAEQPIDEILLLNEQEKQSLLYAWNQTERDFNRQALIHQLFEKQAEDTPSALALLMPKADPLAGAEQQISYRQLNERANQIARYLINQGIGTEDKVTVCMERSPELISALFGILKAGAAYLPIEPTYPDERIQFILRDADVKLVFTQKSLKRKFTEYNLPMILADELHNTVGHLPVENPDLSFPPERLAYIIYTSGSTGQPKGVEVEHRQLVNYIYSAREMFALSPEDRVLQFASVSFDAAAEEVYPCLSSGAALVLRNDAMISSVATFLNSVAKFNITVLDLPTAYWHQLAADILDQNMKLVDTLRLVIIGGERALPERIRQWHNRFKGKLRLLNTYGPTETTVVATWWEASAATESASLFAREVPIGKPVPNCKAYVLDRHLQAVPAGVPGELCIGGSGVARGYLNRPDLTAEKFTTSPFVKGERIYRTGDLVRWLPDGNIEFLGRIDHQVKIRGFRIELGEIEAVLRRHSAVREVILQAREDTPGDRRLVAYYTLQPNMQPEMSELRAHLKSNLPDYMVPAHFVRLDEIPISATGKINYRALPAPEYDRSALEQPYEAPRNELETLLAEIWQDVLGVEKIGIHDNFFKLGGDSLKAAVFINHLQQALDEILYVVVLFDYQTIGGLSEYLVENFPKSVLRYVRTRFQKPEIEARIHTLLERKTEINEEKIVQMKHLLGRYTHEEDKEKAFLNAIKKKNQRTVFIISAPRAGSTLLRVMLAGNPQLFSPPELALLNFRTLKERYRHFTGRDVGWMEGLYRAVMEIHQCDFKTSKKILAEYEEKNYTTAEFYGVLQGWLDGRYIVDKTTTYATDVRILQRAEAVFEQPFYIHLVRHPAAMIQSYLGSNLDQVFGVDLPFAVREKAEMFWLINNQNVLDFFRGVPEDRRFFLRYEELVQNPETVMRDLCDKLEIEFDPEMLNPYSGSKMRDGVHKESKMVGDPRFNTHKTIDPNLAFKWQTLPEGDQLSPFATELGILFGYHIAEKDRSERHISLTPTDRSQKLPLSFAQQRLWFLDQLEPGQANYNIPASIRIRGKTDRTALIRAIQRLAERHESLRTVFSTIDGRAYQTILDDPVIPVEKKCLTELPEADRLNEAMQIVREEAQSPFNLARGPLMRVKLIELDEDDHILMMNMHHIISDGLSVGIIVRDLIEIYRAQLEQRQPQLPSLPVQYADYAVWQRNLLSDTRLQLELKFWEEQFKDAPAMIELPTDRPRPPVQSFNGRRLHFGLSPELSRAINDLARQHEATSFMVLMAAFQTLLHRYAGQETILVGTPIANRNRREVENLVGFFVNTLVIRGDFTDDPDFGSFLEQIKQRSSDAFAHQELPFEKIVDSLNLERNLSHNPLFQVMFAYQPPLLEKMNPPGLRFEPVEIDAGIAKFDMTVSMAEVDGKLGGEWEFNTDLWDAATIERMMNHFINLLTGITQDSSLPVSRYTLLDEQEMQHIIQDFNAVATVNYPRDAVLHELFEKQVERTPDNIALIYKGEAMTYHQLNENANQLAHYLIKKGVKPEQFVGISLERSLNLMAAIWGIFKAGAAYVPMDPSYPHERLDYVVKDTGMDIILVQEKFIESLEDVDAEKIPLDVLWPQIAKEATNNPNVKMENRNLCYVIYTSGSTGWPKGVMVQHNTAVLLAFDYIHQFEINETKHIVQYFSYSFDGSVGDFFMSLLQGASLYLVGQDEMMPDSGLTALMQNNRITNAFFPPSILSVLPSQPLTDLSILASGGDVCTPELVRKWATDERKYYNAYGPTETTVCATWYLTNDLPEGLSNVPIGRPLPNYRIYILDKNLNPTPLGVPGEMFISGDGITRGYLNRPELTAVKFIPDPFADTPGVRMYASGDLCRYLPDGNIEFLGRIDQQVKIRGFRIELGEIESSLLDHPDVKEVIVLAKGAPGNKQLAAYIVPEEGRETSISELRSFLQKRLPEYMTPAFFIFLEQMPIATTGKIDRKRLPEPNISREALKTEFISAKSKNETLLVKIWQDLLNVEQIGVKDNFFELGGDSISSIQMIAYARNQGLVFTPKDIFLHPTIEGLAKIVGQASVAHAEQGLVLGDAPLTPIQRTFFERDIEERHHWNQSIVLETEQAIPRDMLEKMTLALLEHHDALRMHYRKSDEGWRQYIAEPDGVAPVAFVRGCGNDPHKFETEVERLQSSLHLENGPLIRIGYFDMGEQPDRIVIVIHHLVIDGVSWRILLEDFHTIYTQLKMQQELLLPAKTSSFKYWAEKLGEYARSDDLCRELDFWRSFIDGDVPEIPVDHPVASNLEADVVFVEKKLEKEFTQSLLQNVSSAVNIKPGVILIAALANAFANLTGAKTFYVDLEGHGREDIIECVDLSRTVGWFTTLYPFYVDVNGIDDPGELIRLVDAKVRGIANNGIGFGLLKYLSDDDDVRRTMSRIPTAQVSFNYLGRFEQPTSAIGDFRVLPLTNAHERSPLAKREYLIDISASIRGDVLYVRCAYSGRKMNPDRIETLMLEYIAQLKHIIQYASTVDANRLPDAVADVTDDEIDDILNELES
ncbi:MAG: amino acid adenylation domain-containing protein [Calditrichaeota bacterium]|nr:amino acid adenylation domain-containing protein [Calditrichota bacterium]